MYVLLFVDAIIILSHGRLCALPTFGYLNTQVHGYFIKQGCQNP